MSDFRSLVLGMRANTGGLKKGLDQGTAEIGGFVGRVKSMGAGFAGAIGGIATKLSVFGLAASGLSSLTNALTAPLDALGDLADNAERLGVSANALKDLGYAASLAGVDSETLNKSLQKFQRGLGDLQTGKAADDLKLLGLSASDFTGDTIKDFEKVAGAIAAIDEPTKKAEAAFAVFGKSGQDLLVLLNSGAEGIAAAVAESQKLQGGISDEQIAAAEAAGDAIEKLQVAFSASATLATATFAPAIGMVADSLTELAVWGQGKFSSFVTSIKTGLDGCIPIVQQLGNVITARFNSIVETGAWLWNQLSGFWTSTGMPTFEQTRNFILDALIGAEFGFTNFWSIIQVGAKQGLLYLVQFGAGIQYQFTEVIPSWLNWFGENWQEVIGHIINESIRRFENLGANVVQVFKNLPGLIAGTTDWSEVWKPFEQQALASIVDLPDIPDRVIGQMEQGLKSEIAAMSETLGTSFTDLRTKRLGELLPTNAQPIAQAAVQPMQTDAAKVEETATAKLVSANEKGSAGARAAELRHEMRGSGGPSKDPVAIAKETKELAKQQLAELREQNRLLRKADRGSQTDTLTVNVVA